MAIRGAPPAALALVGILSFAVLLLAMPREMTPYDEGIILSDTMRILHGEVFHRDFYANYGPAQSFFLAAIFKVFGVNFFAERVYDVIIRSLTVVLVFKILRENCSLLLSAITTLAVGVWLLRLGYYLYPIFPCILLSLGSSYLVARFGEGRGKYGGLIAAGACTGLTALFRYETGFFVLAAHLAFLTAVIFASDRRGQRLMDLLRAVLAYGVGTGLVFLPMALLFLGISPIQPFLDDILVYPSKYYARMRGLPFPNLRALARTPQEASVYLPPIAVALTALELLRRVEGRPNILRVLRTRDRAGLYLLVFGAVAAALFLKGVVRVSSLHMFMSTAPSMVVLSVLAALWWRRGLAGRAGAVIVLIAMLLPAAVALKATVGADIRSPDSSLAGWLATQARGASPQHRGTGRCETAAASGIAKLPDDYARVANYVAANSRGDERIFVGLDRHDKMLENPVTLYFASGRLPGTHWHQFDPGLQTRADIQAKMIGDLRRYHVRWIVRDASFDGINEPNGSAASSGVFLLDRYIDEHYRPVAVAGPVKVWLIDSEPAPQVVDPRQTCEAFPVGFASAAS